MPSLLPKALAKKLEKYLAENLEQNRLSEYCEPEDMCSAPTEADECVDREDLCAASQPAEKRGICFARPMQAKQGKRSLDDVIEQVGMTFSQCLFKFIDERGMTNADVYKKAGIDRKLFSKIQCSTDYRPTKKTAFALAIALELNLDEAKDLLARAGYAFSPSSVFDLIIQFFIENEVYDIYTINNALYEHDEPTLN